jgi:hypothetical protein
LLTSTLNTAKLHKQDNQPKSVVVLVAQPCAHGVQDISNLNSWADVVYVDCGVHSERVAGLVSSVNVVDTGRVLVLPDAEVAVNKAVVQPKDRVGGRRPGVRHDSSDTVVTPCVGGTLGAAGHITVGALVVASINHALVCVCSLAVVVVASEAMKVVVRAGSDVDG